MTVPSTLASLLSPLDVGPFTLRNRVISTGHNMHYDADGLIGDGTIAFHRRKAMGGVALTTTGGTSVHPSGGMPPVAPLINFDERVLPGYRRLAEEVHECGARMMVQLAHGASANGSHHTGQPVWAPSQNIGAYGREIPHVMTRDEIAQVVSAFGQAAARVATAGLDGIELNLFAGGLAQQFISPVTNRRSDDYGGSLENQLRFVMQLIRACREAMSPAQALALKIAGDELAYVGMHLPDMQEVVAYIDAHELVDYYVVAVGTNLDQLARVDHWPPAPAAHGLYVDIARGIKTVTSRPVAAVGRIIDPTMADRLVSEGACDLVAMVRATIADPDLVAKAAAGRLDEIRPCVGASSGCVDRIATYGEPGRCIYNPIIGRERQWGTLDRAPVPRRVVVVGGGPGGLEAARVAAERGHTVVLLEREMRLGGASLDMARKPERGELAGIPEWLSSEVRRLGVQVRLGVVAGLAEIEAESPDVVILATGATDVAPAFEGAPADLPVVSAWAAIRDPGQLGRNVVVIDELGQDLGCAVAEMVADRGGSAEVVSPHVHPAIDVGLTNTVWLYRRLFKKGVVLTPHHRLSSIERGRILIENVYSGHRRALAGLDTLVVVTPPSPNDQLLGPLVAAGLRVIAVGDCVAPRDVENATLEAHRAARSI